MYYTSNIPHICILLRPRPKTRYCSIVNTILYSKYYTTTTTTDKEQQNHLVKESSYSGFTQVKPYH